MSDRKRKRTVLIVSSIIALIILVGGIGNFLIRYTIPIEVEALDLPVEKAIEHETFITMENASDFYINGESVDKSDLIPELDRLTMESSKEDSVLILDINPDIPYGEVVLLLELLKDNHFSDFRFVTPKKGKS